MALSYSKVGRVVAGNEKCAIVDFTADAAYAAGGYSLAASDFVSLTNVPGATTSTVTVLTSAQNAGGYTIALDKANSKLKYFLGGTEATTTVSSTVVRARLYFSESNSK